MASTAAAPSTTSSRATRGTSPSGAAYSPDRLAEAAAALAERPIALDIYLDVDEGTARRIFGELGGLPIPAAGEG